MIRFIPRETKFFELLAELSSAMNEGARLLRGILEDPHDLEARVEQMQAIEHRGDKAIHAIMTKLNQTFITPFDREDIHHLASSLDDVLDYMNTAATRLVMYKIPQPTAAAGERARVLVLQRDAPGPGDLPVEKGGKGGHRAR